MASNKKLSATITIGGAIDGTLRAAIGTVKSKMGELGSTVRQLERQQRLLGKAIQEFGRDGKNVDGLRARYAAVTREIEKQRAALVRLKSIEDARERNRKRAADIRGMVGTALVAGATFAVPVVQAVKFETAMLGVAKQVQGARDDAGKLTPVYFDMAKKIQMLGRELPIATNEIAGMVTAAARMNVPTEDLVEFTRTAAVMATAFEAPAEELADSMGKIATIFKIPMKSLSELGDSINYLDDNAISKGADIIKVLQGDLAGAASTMGLSAKNAAALASTFLTLGESAERADTAASGMLRQLQIAKMNPKRFQVGVEMIGLTADKLQKGMIADPQGMILKVLDAIKKLPQEKQMEAVTRLFGKDWGGAIAKLAGGVDEYRRQLELANGEAAKGSMSREFQARMQTTAARWETLKNRVTEVGVNIGSVLLPPLNKAMGYFASFTENIADFAREHPTLVKNIMIVGGAFAAFGAAKIAVMGVTWAVGALAVAVMANPIGLTITALAAGALLVYKNWKPIKAFFIDLWDGITAAFKKALEWIVGKLAWVGEKVAEAKKLLGLGEGAAAASEKPSGPLEFESTEGGAAVGARLNIRRRALPQPSMAGAGRGSGYTDNSQTTFQITQQPGENAEQLAKRVSEIQARERGVRQRSAMYEGAY